jgi:hypothetical protein
MADEVTLRPAREDDIELHRIWAATEAGNIAEQKSLAKAGFTREGIQRGVGAQNSRSEPCAFQALTKPDDGGRRPRDWASVRMLRGGFCGVPGCGEVEQGHGVVVGGAGFGGVDAEALAGCALQLHALEGEGDRADVGVVEGLVLVRGGAASDVVAFP